MSIEEPKVYLATYSNTDVYESIINDCPLMRRCKDNWVNATQILKCCNFPKAKRTKILEKGVQQGLHQKIQGGYGRFQGTWIPLPDAQRLAANYGVTAEIAPILFFDPSNPGFELAKKTKEINKDGTPVKRKYIKKKKPDGSASKKLKVDDNQQSFQDFNPTDSFNSISRMPSHLSNYSSQNSQFPMGSFNQPDFNGINQYNQIQPTNNDYQNYQMQVQMQMQMQQQMNQPQIPSQNHQYPFGGFSLQSNQPQQLQQQQQQQQQPQQQQIPSMPSQQIAHPHIMGQFHHSKVPSSQSTNETNWSQDENNKESDTSMSSNEDIRNKSKESYSAQLLKFFSEENSPIPYFIHNPPFDFNINEAIDDEGHTPLHWAASIGNYPMIHLLMTKGANALVVNNYGLNPLSRLISFNNCFELKNFPKVLDDLEICLINTDINGRTPLHYLCQFSKVESKYESLRYYLGVILNKLTALTSTNTSTNLLKNVLDHQDVNGDTCLHLAVKAGCSKIAKFLLYYNARDDLYNVSQETSKYLIMKSDLLKESPSEIETVLAPIPVPTVTNSSANTMPSKTMATPTRTKMHSLETPDTQRTTVQDDDDDDHNNARVDKEHINQLIKQADDDKENIFLEPIKPTDSMSTPIAGSKHSFLTSSLSQQPLAVISERTAESTPMEVDKLQGNRNQDLPQTYQVKPPKIDEDGNIIEVENNDKKQIPGDEISSMLTKMVNALTQAYEEKVKDLDEQQVVLRSKLATNEATTENITGRAIINLSKVGIEDFNTLSDAVEVLNSFSKEQDSIAKSKEDILVNGLEQIQAFQLANLVSANEDYSHDTNDNDDNNTPEMKVQLAIELTNLQIKRSNLLNELTDKIKFYGIDEKMYKYRKLISLSCGLNIDDIDSLIDGIEESLMAANSKRL